MKTQTKKADTKSASKVVKSTLASLEPKSASKPVTNSYLDPTITSFNRTQEKKQSISVVKDSMAKSSSI